jgi:hypothetical protein
VIGASREDGEVVLESLVNLHACKQFALFLRADDCVKRKLVSYSESIENNDTYR